MRDIPVFGNGILENSPLHQAARLRELWFDGLLGKELSHKRQGVLTLLVLRNGIELIFNYQILLFYYNSL